MFNPAPKENELATTLRARSLARVWDSRVQTWPHHALESPAFTDIRQAIVAAAKPCTDDDVVDLGAGNGQLSMLMAAQVRSVLAVDLSPLMLASLSQAAASAGASNVTVRTADLARFDLPLRSVDTIVSCYALHHLTDREKTRLLLRMQGWLRPGGRLVIADMMIGRGASREDRSIARSKAAALARRGPAGWWRIAKNVVRFGLRLGSERPASAEFWRQQALSAGFTDVQCRRLVAEAGLLTAQAPTKHEPATGCGDLASPRERTVARGAV